MSGINRIQGIEQQKFHEISGIRHQGATQKTQESAAPKKGDGVEFSDEIKKPEKADNVNIQPITNQINQTKGLAECDKVGMPKGIQEGGVMGRNGIQGGFDPGMQSGAVFSSRRS